MDSQHTTPPTTEAGPATAEASPVPEIPVPETPPPRHVSGRPADLLPGHRLVTITGGDLWMEAEAFVYEMYVAIGYTQSSNLRRVEELSRWADRSRFHAVLDEDDRIVGTVRTIFGNYAELPVSQFDRTDHSDADPVCELSSLVVDPNQRSTGVIEHLYRAGWLDAWRSGIQAVVALIDDWLYDVFRQTYCLPFHQIGKQMHYMGTDPVPVGLPLQGGAYEELARVNPRFWAWTLEAIEAQEVRDWHLPIVLLDDEPARPAATTPADHPTADRR